MLRSKLIWQSHDLSGACRGDDQDSAAPYFQNPLGFLVLILVLFYLFVFPITAVFSGRECGSSPRSLLTFLPPPVWPKISCDSKSLISNRYPPAALTPFGHVARFQAPGIKSWVSSKAIVVTHLSTSKYELN